MRGGFGRENIDGPQIFFSKDRTTIWRRAIKLHAVRALFRFGVARLFRSGRSQSVKNGGFQPLSRAFLYCRLELRAIARRLIARHCKPDCD